MQSYICVLFNLIMLLWVGMLDMCFWQTFCASLGGSCSRDTGDYWKGDLTFFLVVLQQAYKPLNESNLLEGLRVLNYANVGESQTDDPFPARHRSICAHYIMTLKSHDVEHGKSENTPHLVCACVCGCLCVCVCVYMCAWCFNCHVLSHRPRYGPCPWFATLEQVVRYLQVNRTKNK